ncbi:MAG: diadenylate cyclase CdaA [Candidatus Peregrinibacteria bacterium]|nr:diadenylate cyclase CdaA [Candidatus Peregrinibacteria bacterium]
MNVINDVFSRIVFFFSELGESFWEHLSLSQYSFWQTSIDILLVAMLFYWLIIVVKGTRAVHILTGLLVLAMLYLISSALDLLAVNWILSRTYPIVLLSIPIIFQQEIRRGLERLGKTRFLGAEIETTDRIISDIVEACETMAKQRHGALIVFERDTRLQEYIETGDELDALISKELIVSIFHPKLPLHDGAIIIRDQRILAAGCILPHTFKEYDSKLGMRHKAAISLSQNSDAQIIVISEERKTISFAQDGRLTEVNSEELQKRLERIYKMKKKKSSKSRRSS